MIKKVGSKKKLTDHNIKGLSTKSIRFPNIFNNNVIFCPQVHNIS